MIAPTDLKDFARSLGWYPREEGSRHRLYVLEKRDLPYRQLVFPMDIEAPDYLEASELVLDKLGEILGQEREVVRSAALLSKEDVLKFRVKARGLDQTLPLAFAARVLAGSERLLRSAACTVINPRIHHPRLSCSEALSLIDHCNFGHTQPGSFVMTVSCPVRSVEATGRMEFAEKSPFVRQVVLAIYQGLERLITAIETDGLDSLTESLKEAKQPLISSNFCESLLEFQDQTLQNSLELSVDWSAQVPVPPSYQGRRLHLQADYFARIEDIRHNLRQPDLLQEASYWATVERLEGEMDEEGQRSGEVVLQLFLPTGEAVTARASLSPEQYAQAHQVHMKQDSYVAVTGRLHPGRQPRRLQVSRFGA